MEGAAKAELKKIDLGILTAWHTAAFVLGMYSGKLKGKRLTDYLTGDRSAEPDTRSDAAKAVAFFHGLKTRGFDVKIERVVH